MTFSNVQSDMDDLVKDNTMKIIIDSMQEANKAAGEYAQTIKCALDENLKGTWHVIVGKSFGSDLMHESRYYFSATYGQYNIIAFRAGYLW